MSRRDTGLTDFKKKGARSPRCARLPSPVFFAPEKRVGSPGNTARSKNELPLLRDRTSHFALFRTGLREDLREVPQDCPAPPTGNRMFRTIPGPVLSARRTSFSRVRDDRQKATGPENESGYSPHLSRVDPPGHHPSRSESWSDRTETLFLEERADCQRDQRLGDPCPGHGMTPDNRAKTRTFHARESNPPFSVPSACLAGHISSLGVKTSGTSSVRPLRPEQPTSSPSSLFRVRTSRCGPCRNLSNT